MATSSSHTSLVQTLVVLRRLALKRLIGNRRVVSRSRHWVESNIGLEVDLVQQAVEQTVNMPRPRELITRRRRRFIVALLQRLPYVHTREGCCIDCGSAATTL